MSDGATRDGAVTGRGVAPGVGGARTGVSDGATRDGAVTGRGVAPGVAGDTEITGLDSARRAARARAAALSAALVAVALIAWEAVARFADVDRLLIAAPTDVAEALWRERALLAEHSWVTAREAVLGIGAAFAIGVSAGIALHLSRPLRDAAYPLLIGSQSVPVVVIAPLLVIAFGYGALPKIMIVALVCFFPLVVNTLDGLRAVDPELHRLMRSLGAGRLRTLRAVELPAALPNVFTGARVAATWAFIGAVFGEYAGSDAGLGYLIARGTPSFETARVYAAVLILAALSLALYGLLTLLERRLIPWARHRT